jgi:hypothetical protein
MTEEMQVPHCSLDSDTATVHDKVAEQLALILHTITHNQVHSMQAQPRICLPEPNRQCDLQNEPFQAGRRGR